MLIEDTTLVNWNRADEAFLVRLDDVVAQQQTLDMRDAYELQQQQLEQSVWWAWMQAMRDGALPLPPDWKDPLYPNPYLAQDTHVPTADIQREDPLQCYMPTLTSLKRAVSATHGVYIHLDANSDKSCAWTYGRRAGDFNWVPYNHFAAIKFILTNEKMIQSAVELMVSLGGKLEKPSSLSSADLRFVQNWLVAREILAKLDELNTHAYYWTEMHDVYGEWAEPLPDPYKL